MHICTLYSLTCLSVAGCFTSYMSNCIVYQPIALAGDWLISVREGKGNEMKPTPHIKRR